MIRNSFLAILAVAVLGGCMTSGYSYRDGRGDYYYGQPTIQYRHYGYGTPYGSLGYGYYDYYGYGYQYGYYDYPYGYYDYPYRYYHYAPPQQPPAQPPQDPDRSDLSAKEWAEEHGYPLNGPGPSGDSNALDANRRRLQVTTPGLHMRSSSPSQPAIRAPSNPDTRARAASGPATRMVQPTQPASRAVAPSRPRTSSRPASPPRVLPARPASQRASGSNGDDDIRLRKRRP